MDVPRTARPASPQFLSENRGEDQNFWSPAILTLTNPEIGSGYPSGVADQDFEPPESGNAPPSTFDPPEAPP